MINVTDNAVRHLHNLLSQRPEDSREGLRVEVAKGGCSGLHYEMTLGEREEGDAIVERDGVQFFIDDDSVSYLRGATLDFTDGLTGTGFRIVNPNASRTCGCGSSFETSH
jgi:iron-sulfur cluster assembly protein